MNSAEDESRASRLKRRLIACGMFMLWLVVCFNPLPAKSFAQFQVYFEQATIPARLQGTWVFDGKLDVQSPGYRDIEFTRSSINVVQNTCKNDSYTTYPAIVLGNSIFIPGLDTNQHFTLREHPTGDSKTLVILEPGPIWPGTYHLFMPPCPRRLWDDQPCPFFSINYRCEGA